MPISGADLFEPWRVPVVHKQAESRLAISFYVENEGLEPEYINIT